MSQEKRSVYDMLVKIDERLDQMAIISAKQQVSLDEHIKRTELLENELRPIRKHVYMVQGVGAFITLLGVVAGIIAALR